MAKGSSMQSIQAYLREQQKAINSETRNYIKSNNYHADSKTGGGNRPMNRGQ